MNSPSELAPTVVTDVPDTALTSGERRHLAALERRIERGMQTFKEVGAALMEVRDSRLYRDKFSSFEAYCRERWAIERQRAYQLIGAVEVIDALPAGDQDMVRNEATARELVPILHSDDPAALAEVWAGVREESVATGRPVTAETVRTVKARVFPARVPTPADLMERLLAEANRVKALYAQWVASGPDRKTKRNVDSAIRAITQV